MVGVLSPGGVIFSHIAFVGEWDNALVTVKHKSSASWTTADTMGARDTTGCANVYIEDSTFVGGSNGISDCDDGCRMVIRYNTFGYGGQDSGGPNSHGQDTSPIGMRHMEIYDNDFLFPDHTCNNCGNQCLSNVNQFIWNRGGTGVIFDNYFDHLSSQCWGTKTEIRFDIRGAEDARPQGSCGNTHYPVPHQIGQTLTAPTLSGFGAIPDNPLSVSKQRGRGEIRAGLIGTRFSNGTGTRKTLHWLIQRCFLSRWRGERTGWDS